MVPLTVVREMLREVAKTREENLAFRSAVTDHENGELQKLKDENSKSPPVKLSASGGGGRGGGNGRMLPANRADLRVKPPSLRIPNGVPRNINSLITWDVVKIRGSTATSASALTEINQNANLSAHPQATSWQSLFDQWCIPLFSCTFYSLEPPGSTGNVVELHTAIDFDNIATLGSLTALDDFGTSQVDTLVLNKSVTRSCKPCIKLASGSNTLAVMGRQWCDCAQLNTQWNGIRAIAGIASSGSSNTIISEVTIVYAFRNAI
jgi:hypothetical protein